MAREECRAVPRAALANQTVHSTAMPVSLSARDVSHAYDAQQVLAGVSVDVPGGASVALVGESGSGKTTLLRCFNRMVEPRTGA